MLEGDWLLGFIFIQYNFRFWSKAEQNSRQLKVISKRGVSISKWTKPAVCAVLRKLQLCPEYKIFCKCPRVKNRPQIQFLITLLHNSGWIWAMAWWVILILQNLVDSEWFATYLPATSKKLTLEIVYPSNGAIAQIGPWPPLFSFSNHSCPPPVWSPEHGSSGPLDFVWPSRPWSSKRSFTFQFMVENPLDYSWLFHPLQVPGPFAILSAISRNYVKFSLKWDASQYFDRKFKMAACDSNLGYYCQGARQAILGIRKPSCPSVHHRILATPPFPKTLVTLAYF